MKKLEKMVKAYNEYATKHGYSTIEIDYENMKVIGEFTPKDPDTYNGFFTRLSIAGENGYLQEDYNKIVKRLENYRQDRVNNMPSDEPSK